MKNGSLRVPEGKWRHLLNIRPDLEAFEEHGNLESVRVSVLAKIRDFIENCTNDELKEELEDLAVRDLEDLEGVDDVEEFDYWLEQLWDFCDEWLIFVPLTSHGGSVN